MGNQNQPYDFAIIADVKVIFDDKSYFFSTSPIFSTPSQTTQKKRSTKPEGGGDAIENSAI